jgi:hypothetical protein
MAYIETNGIRIRKKKRKWLTEFTVSVLLAIITLVSVISANYYAMKNTALQEQYTDLQNLLYNFQPFIFSINSTSTLNSLYCMRKDTMAVLDGLVTVDLKVVTPYDGMLTINVKTLNLTYTNELKSELE